MGAAHSYTHTHTFKALLELNYFFVPAVYNQMQRDYKANV